MPFLSVDDANLYYECTGALGSSAVVFVHGSWGDHHDWDAVIPFLSDLQLVSYDRRGHSQSSRVGRSGDVSQDAADLAALIESLELAPAHVVGHSFGAAVGLRLAADRPALVRSLFIHEAPLFGLLTDGDEAEMRDGIERSLAAVRTLLSEDRMEEGARHFLETVAFEPRTWERMPTAVREIWISNAPAVLDQLQDLSWATPDLREVARSPVPIMPTKGDRSPEWEQRVMDHLSEALLHREPSLIAGVGHAPHLSQPEQFAAILRSFLESVTDL